VKTTTIASLLSILLVSAALGQEEAVTRPVPAAKPAVKAATAGEFTFTFDRTSMEYDGCNVWGTVRSTKPGRLVKEVAVVLTAYDANDKMIGRTSTQAESTGEVAYINECSIDTAKTLPTRIEAKIVPAPSYDDIEVVRSEEETSSDAPLEFKLQKIGSNYGGTAIWGVVTNTGDTEYESVTVVVTLYGPEGKFLGRGRGSANPGTIGKGQIGYVDGLGVDVGDWKPVKLEWKILTSEY
jgi:hypothetical protein